MSSDNQAIGETLYETGDSETRDWFRRQWAAWPERVDEDKTTNISLLYGGVQAFRAAHDAEPEISDDFKECVAVMDKYQETAR